MHSEKKISILIPLQDVAEDTAKGKKNKEVLNLTRRSLEKDKICRINNHQGLQVNIK